MLSKILRKIICSFIPALAAMQNCYFRYSLGWMTWLYHRKLTIGHRVIFNVPVCMNGEGEVEIGDDCMLGFRLGGRMGSGAVLLQARTEDAKIKIGQRCSLNNNFNAIANVSIEIGERCLIGNMVQIMDSDFHEIAPEKRRSGPGKCAPVKIGDNVWLGTRCIILKGVEIGNNSIVAPMSVVTKSFPANVIVAGIPAKVIRKI